MDGERFDGFARRVVGLRSRRTMLGAAMAALVGGRGAAARGPVAEQCIPAGNRCGGDRRACRWCCSRHAVVAGAGRRCACKPDGARCNNSSQCCGGACVAGTCGATETTLAVRATGTATATSEPGCEGTEDGCVYAVAVRAVEAYPIAAASLVAEVTVRGHVRAETGLRYDAFAVATIEVVEKITADTVVVAVEAEVVGKVREVTFTADGRYAVVKGTGRYADASGIGDAKIVVERGALKSLVLSGEIHLATV